eukprot:1519416-Rhodomonas_salina.1
MLSPVAVLPVPPRLVAIVLVARECTIVCSNVLLLLLVIVLVLPTVLNLPPTGSAAWLISAAYPGTRVGIPTRNSPRTGHVLIGAYSDFPIRT